MKQVFISIKGLQFDGSANEEAIEVVTVGNYYKKNGKHYITFDEVLEGFDGITKNIVKISEDSLAITKNGLSNVHMVFEKNKKNITCYNTPYGNFMIGISGKSLSITETEDNIHVKVDYRMDVNYEHLADCEITMNIKSKEAKDFSLFPS